MTNKILFISNKSFDQLSGGSILFSRLFNNINLSNISWFVCDDIIKNSTNFEFLSKKYIYIYIFSNRYINHIVRKTNFLSFPFFFVKYKILPSIFFLFNKNYFKKFDKNWIYVTQSTIPLSKIIHKSLKIDYHLSIQDDYSTHLRKSEHLFLANDFKYLIENAKTIDFISEFSEYYYKKKYCINAVTTNFIISNITKTNKPLISKKIHKIGFSGNIWCGETFESFLNAIKLYNDFNNEELIIMMFSSISPKSKLINKYKKFIKLQPFISYDKLTIELQKCDLLYLPMSFSKSNEVVNTTSFPSKIITYLNCGIPILNHSPSNSSSHSYILNKHIGFSINLLNPTEIFKELNYIIESSTNVKRAKISENMNEVIQEFNTTNNINKLMNLINNE